MSELRKQVESLLFSSGRAMNIDDIATVMNVEKKEVKKALKELKEYYDSADTSLMVTEEGDSWKLNIREKYVSLVTKIVTDTELSKTVLETLSVIAWKSPVLQSEVIKIRTNKAYDHIKELVDAGFISKEKEGRSYRLRISEKFFEYFDVPGDKGIKEAFQDVKVPEKKEPKKLGELEVVKVDNDSVEHGKTAEIFGETQPIPENTEKEEGEEEPEEEPESGEEKGGIPPVDNDFLSDIDKRIDEVSKKNDDIEEDELFKKKKEEGLESQASEGEEGEESDDGVEDGEEKEEDSPDEDSESSENKDSEEEKPDDTESDESETEPEEDSEEKEESEESEDETTEEISEELEESEKELEEETDQTEEGEEEEKKENASG